MKATYTLTWEEFAELHGDAWPRPDYLSVIGIAIVAVPLVAYGITLAVYEMPGEYVSSMFIGGPLFLLVAGLVSLKLQPKKAMSLAIAEKRSEYERWHAKEQSFSFDQERWIHECPAGRLDVPWPALLRATELPNVFVLMGESGSAIVPKRVLDPAALNMLGQLAFPVPADSWPFQIRAWDYQATETATLWRKFWFRLAFGNVFGLAVLGWIAHLWLTSDDKTGVLWGWILAALAVVITLSAQIWYLPLRYATSRRRWRAPKNMALADRGLYLSDAYGSFFNAWRSFRGFREVGRAFLIYTDVAHYYLLSKRYFSPDQQIEIRRMLQGKLKLSED